VPAIREALFDTQFDLAQASKFPVVILIGGMDGPGKGDTACLLNEWRTRATSIQRRLPPTAIPLKRLSLSTPERAGVVAGHPLLALR